MCQAEGCPGLQGRDDQALQTFPRGPVSSVQKFGRKLAPGSLFLDGHCPIQHWQRDEGDP